MLPCLIVVGNANGAIALLRILKTLCPGAALLSGLRRCDLSNLRGQCWTLLVSEPNLDKRTASILGDLTDRSFRVVDSNGLMMYSRSTAIYVGENSSKYHIANSIEIHIPTSIEGSPLSPAWLYKMASRLPVHLSQYRDGHMAAISSMTWVPQGLSPEEQVLATALGRSVVDSPVLLRKLYSLVKADDHSRFSEMAITDEAVVVQAVLLLSSDGREKAYVKEIAAAVNGLRKARGETASLSPEKVGHRLKNLGLAARRLDKDGNGLTFNTVTVAKIEQLATVYVVEDAPAGGENLLKSQTTETKQDGEVM